MARTKSSTTSTITRTTGTTRTTTMARRNSRYVERDQKAEELLRDLHRAKQPAERERLTDEIVRLHLDLCDGLATRYSGRSIPTEDLVQVARMALVVAIQRYRPAPGTSFIGYALPTISGELKRHFRDHGWMVRPPRRLQELGPVLRLAREHWEQEHGSSPTPQELASELDVGADQVVECLSAEHSYHPLSLDLTFGDDESRPLSDSLAEPQEELESAPDRVSLAAALGSLCAKDRELLQMRFVDGMTQKEIGMALGVSQMQVSRLVRTVLERLRGLMGVTVEPEHAAVA